MKTPLFYHKKPMFGLDIGSQTVKFMQLAPAKQSATVRAYGSVATKEKVMQDGVITNVAAAAKQVDELLAQHAVGTLTTNRVVMGIPVSHVYTRVLKLPMMSGKELSDAIKLEVEQSVPAPIKNLYYDYETTDIDDPENMLVRMVAAPRSIVDSYEAVCAMLGLDLSLVQTNIRADAQLCMLYEDIAADRPYIIVDVGGDSIDIGIFDKTLRVTGTVDEGGNSLTEAISSTLKVSHDEAHDIKISQGIGPGENQEKIVGAVTPILSKVIAEIKKIDRFYAERVSENAELSQILILGGGANMPGLGDYLTNAMHTAARVVSPWGRSLQFGKLEPPELADLPRFLTCAGLALATEEEAIGV